MTRALFLAIGAAFVTFTSSARAEDPAKLAAAESLFQDGIHFKEAGNYVEASKRFARSEELLPAVGTLLNLGECHEQLHELAQAWLAYRQAIAVADANADKRAARARKNAADIEPRVPHLTIVASNPRPTITRDGAPVDAAALNAAVAIDPGRHVVARTSWQKTIDIAEGQSLTVTVPEIEATPATHDPRRAIGIGMEIGGGVVLVAGLVSGAIALSQWHSVEDQCPNAGCDRSIASAQQHDVDVARTWATLGTAGIIGGAAILAGGIALHLTAPKDQVSIAPVVGQQAAGFALVWRR